MPGVLDGKVAIVTGAGRGIGRGVAMLMAQEGARVVVNDPGVNLDGSGQDVSIAQTVVNEIKQAGGEAVANTDSVATMQGGENLIKTALDNFKQLDIVVTPHGILRDRMIFNMTEEEWDDVIRVHLKGTFCVMKPASVLFRQQRSGCMITFSSESGLVGNSWQANYGAAKSGIAGLTKVLARDLGRYGVRANSIAPRALTRMTQQVPDSVRQLRSQMGIAGIGEGGEGEASIENHPDDIAPFVVYLASDFAQNVNGQTFLVYGGTIAVMSQPRQSTSLFKDGHWTVEELDPLCLDYLTKDLVNPAPARTTS